MDMQKESKIMEPVRKITNKGIRKIIGKFPSIKNGRSILFESMLEKDFLYHLESNDSITKYCEQPCKIKYYFNGKNRMYVPDFGVEWIGRRKPSLIEVKPYAKVVQNAERLRNIKNAIEAEGYDFQIYTEVYIRSQPRLDNLKYLNRFSKVKVSLKCESEIISYLREHNEVVRISELVNLLNSLGVSVAELYRMITNGTIFIEISSPINDQALVRI
jgi:hypothetical protein